MTLLNTRSLSVQTGSKQLCNDLDFELGVGEYWGILGGNGIGKTSLIHTLAGLRSPRSGAVYIDDLNLQDWNRRELARNLGILFQDSFDTFPSTVMETALTGRYPYLSFWEIEGQKDLDIATQALTDVALDSMLDRQVDTLSGGERRRLAIAILLIQSPRIWLLDEPTNHLDMHHQIILLELLRNRVEMMNGGVLMVLHDVNLVVRFCTHAMLMIGPDKILCGPIDDVICKENLQLLYGHAIRVLEDGDSRVYMPE